MLGGHRTRRRRSGARVRTGEHAGPGSIRSRRPYSPLCARNAVGPLAIFQPAHGCRRASQARESSIHRLVQAARGDEQAAHPYTRAVPARGSCRLVGQSRRGRCLWLPRVRACTGTVFVPEHASPTKLEAMRRYGIEVRQHGDDSLVSEQEARRYADTARPGLSLPLQRPGRSGGAGHHRVSRSSSSCRESRSCLSPSAAAG